MCNTYMLTSPSGKSYIGVAVDVSKRFYRHKRNKTPIGSAVRKYGNRFAIRTLVIADPSYCYELESRLIEVYDTRWPNGYNMASGGSGGQIPHPITIEKMKKSSRRRYRKNKDSEETKRRKREAAIQNWADPSFRKRMKAARSTEESIKKRRQAAKEQWSDPNFKKKMRPILRRNSLCRYSKNVEKNDA